MDTAMTVYRLARSGLGGRSARSEPILFLTPKKECDASWLFSTVEGVRLRNRESLLGGHYGHIHSSPESKKNTDICGYCLRRPTATFLLGRSRQWGLICLLALPWNVSTCRRIATSSSPIGRYRTRSSRGTRLSLPYWREGTQDPLVYIVSSLFASNEPTPLQSVTGIAHAVRWIPYLQRKSERMLKSTTYIIDRTGWAWTPCGTLLSTNEYGWALSLTSTFAPRTVDAYFQPLRIQERIHRS